MEFHAFLHRLAQLGLVVSGEQSATLEKHWEASSRARPGAPVPFLQPDQVKDACDAAGFDAAAAEAALAAAARIAEEPAFQALAWHCRYCLYQAPEYPSDLIRRWPVLDAALHEHAGLFYLLVLLSNVTALRSFYAGHAIPETVLRDTLRDIQRWIPECQDTTGYLGLLPKRLTWLRNHLRAELFHLVRLQFQPGRFQAGAIAYRHRVTRRVLALSEGNIGYRADGQIDGAGGVFDPHPWITTLEEDDQGMRGYPLLPEGFAVNEQWFLPKAEWERVLSPGDPVLHIHIPEGNPMDFDQCGESLRAACDFFPRHLPEYPFRAFACSSWLLDRQLQDMLSPSSNIARFQREMYLLPSGGSGRSTLERVFGRVPADLSDPSQAPRDTSLRRALIDHLHRGGHLRSGRCFRLADDLAWGGM
jgi:hypothetical protein